MRWCLAISLAVLFGCAGHSTPAQGPATEAAYAEVPPAGERFPLEFDHIFIMVEENAPEAEVLRNLGLQPSGQINRHVGLGTAGTYFFFENAYLELIWVADEEAVARATRQMGMPRFGVALRRTEHASSALPFAAQPVRWEWMPEGAYLHIADQDPSATETLVFVVPEAMAYRSPRPVVSTHPAGIRRVTGVRIAQEGDASATGRLLHYADVRIEQGHEPLVELTFDGGVQQRVLDARPTLPLIIRY
jgi:hypothetical protein